MYKQIALALSIGLISLPVLAKTTSAKATKIAEIHRILEICVDKSDGLGGAGQCTIEAIGEYNKLMTPSQRKKYQSKEKACDVKYDTSKAVDPMEIANNLGCKQEAAESIVKK